MLNRDPTRNTYKNKASDRAENNKDLFLKVNVHSTSRESPVFMDEVERLGFVAHRRACGGRDREIVYSDVRALMRGIRNGLLAVAPFWLVLVLWLAK